MDKTFSFLFETYLEVKKEEIRQISYNNIKYAYTGIYKPIFKNTLIDDIKMLDIQKVFINKKRIKSGSRKEYLSILSSFFKWCVDCEIAQKNPVSKIKVRNVVRKEGIALSANQARSLIRLAKNDLNKKLYPFVVFALHTGLRKRSILNLQPEHIKNDIITIPAKFSKSKRPIVIPLHPSLRSFVSELPLNLNVSTLTTSFYRIRSKFEVPTITIHSLRHSVGTFLAAKCSISVTAAILGHKPDSSVTSLYIHINMEQMRSAILKLPEIIDVDEKFPVPKPRLNKISRFSQNIL